MLLNINNLSRKFDGKEVLNIPQLSIEQGELVGILGNNGAGKTTLFRLCLNLLQATEENVSINNHNVALSSEWKKYTSAFIDDHFLIDFLTPMEHFDFTGYLYGVDKLDIMNLLNDFISFLGEEILKDKKKRIEKFSKGNKQKIGIVSAMITLPKLLILDEPFNFLDPSSQIQMKKLLQNYNQKYKATVLLSSHNLQYIMDVCSRITVLESGRIVHDVSNPDEAAKTAVKNYFENRL
ncbi:MAG: ABC transporter ATP-binding protein [Dysgonamonadaceae bacterium]|jgi:ABC-2 type transport system ATP-binding protein|nr:ABC transporter ATP-binding protein [Dysgonamonadaceae bacterium]